MRPIKFRAKKKHWQDIEDFNVWLYSNGYYFDDINYWFTLPSDYKAIAFAKNELIDIETLGQFTGLHDKNGKEIYEGDIIDGGGWGNVEIKFGSYDNGEGYEDKEAGLGFYLRVKYNKSKDKIQGFDAIDWLFKNKPEVIGNIYEKPELLKES